MDKSAADAFVYAKASGILANSFVGKRAQLLFSVNSIGELWSLLFNSEIPSVPETVLARTLENQAQESFLKQYKSLLSHYSKPAEVLVDLLDFYEVSNLKEIGAALCFGEKELPQLYETKPFNKIKYEKWPNIQAMTQDSPYSWYDSVPLLTEQQQNDYRLDCQYLSEIWESAKAIHSSCKQDVVSLFYEHIRIENAIWTLRLRIYYQMPDEEILFRLESAFLPQEIKESALKETKFLLNLELDDYEQWKKWSFARLLNPHEEGVVWTVDPRWVYNLHRKEYVEKAKRLFHKHPFTECPLLCFFLIKRNELDTIRTASESLRLNVDSAQAMEIAGLTEVKNG